MDKKNNKCKHNLLVYIRHGILFIECCLCWKYNETYTIDARELLDYARKNHETSPFLEKTR